MARSTEDAGPEPAGSGDGARNRAAHQRDADAQLRDGVAGQRDDGAGERDADAGERDLVTTVRDREAARRDKDAASRDQVSALREDAAVVRDHAAEQRDRPGVGPTSGRTAVERLVLARRAAASDREHSRQDRSAGAVARGSAEADRGSAGQDRVHSGSDRSAAEQDRDAARDDRGTSTDERSSAVLDRQSARGDRDEAAADRRAASLDELTGAYLRRPGLLQLERDLSRASRDHAPLVVAFVDVDGLKAVNDQRGHAAGDTLLRKVARVLQAQLRPHDLIIRVGGDEFVCVIAGLGQHEVAQRMAHANTALGTTPDSGSVTVGLAQLQPGDTVHDLMERADQDLYRQRTRRPPQRH